AVILCREQTIVPDLLPVEVLTAGEMKSAKNGSAVGNTDFRLPDEGIDLERLEKELIFQALEKAGGNQTQAAKLLGISRYTLIYRMEKYGFKGVEA
ncbi:MAG: helix-turn-helix domain-containing protein, partial [Methylocystaceae bacterium]